MTDVSAGFRPPCWCPSRWAPAWRLHTNLYKFGENVSPHIFQKKNCCDLNLGESLRISTFFLFPDSGLNLPGGGVLPYIGYIGMCGPKGYGFSAVLVINRVSIVADFGHFGHK